MLILNGLAERKRSSSEGRPYIFQEEIREVATEFIGGLGLGLLAGMLEAEMRMRAGAGSATTAAIGKHKTTQGHANFFTCERRAVN